MQARDETYFGAFAHFGAPASDAVYPYFQFGYTQFKRGGSVSDSFESVSIADDGNDIAYGFGVEFGSNQAVGNFEWMNYYDDAGIEVSGISFGAVFRFGPTDSRADSAGNKSARVV